MESTESFRNDHRNFQRFSWIVVASSLALAGFIYWDSQSKIEKARSTSYVSVGGYTYPVETRNGLDYPERIHEYETMAELYYVWRYSADEGSLRAVPSAFERALSLVEPGETTDAEVLRFERDQVNKNVIEDGWKYTVRKDSILWDIWEGNGKVKPKPWKGYIFGKQTIEMGRRSITRNMYVGFEVLDFPSGVRNHKNSFAAWLRNTDIFNNEVITTK